MTAILENILTDLVIIAITTGGIGIVTSPMRKTMRSLKIGFDTLTKRFDTLESTVKEHTETITDIALCDNVMKRIDQKVKLSLEYIDKNDSVILSFIQHQGELAKECIEWAIKTKLNVTEGEVRGKFESCNIEVRELLVKTPSEFSQLVRPALIGITQHHIERVIQIATDELFNSKLDRFFTLTEQTVNEVLAVIVRGRIENQIHKDLVKS